MSRSPTLRPYTILRPATVAVVPVPAPEPPPVEAPLPLPEDEPLLLAAGVAFTGTPSTVVPGTGGGFTDKPTGLTATAGLPNECTTGATAIRAGVTLIP